MVQYASAAELAVHVEHDVDQAKADQILKLASSRFSRAASTWFAETPATLTVAGTGDRKLRLPHSPIQAITSVTIAGVVVTDYTRINSTLYRSERFGSCTFPPDKVEVVYTHGYTTVPDDVKGVVLDMAEQAYEVTAGMTAEQIDDYSARFAAGVGEIVSLTPGAEALAADYRGIFVA